MQIKLKRLSLQNFMAYHEKVVDFTETTKIVGKNGKGKSSILTAYAWLLFNCDYELRDNPKVRREIDGVPVADMDTFVEGIFEIDGKEVIAKKVQKRKFAKDGIAYSDDNTYFINEVPKALRDYNEYFDLDMQSFKICSNVNAFLGQKTKEMRDFLFGTVDEVTDYDVACKYDDLEPLMELLQQYKLEEIIAMNKASKAKVSKELPVLEGQIKEKERDCTADNDFAELELKKNELAERILEVEQQSENSDKLFEEYQKQSDGILDLKFDMNEIVRKANESLVVKKNAVQARLDQANEDFEITRRQIGKYESDIEYFKDSIAKNESKREQLATEWHDEKQKVFLKFEELPALDEDAMVCPTCGQDLPEEVRAQKAADYEQRKEQHKEKYDKEKALFEKTRDQRIVEIEKQGKELAGSIAKDKEEIKRLEEQLEPAKNDSVRCNGDKTKAMQELTELPQSIDLSDNQEYEVMQLQLANMEEALKQMNNGADYRSQLKIQLSGLREELSIVEKELAKADTSEAEQRLEELKNTRIDLEQAKADCEHIIFLTDELDKHKNEMLADEINAQFKYVNWRLFELNKSGGYKSVCIPTIDDKSLLDISSNKGNRILGKLDICNSIQKIADINCPVFLDDAESLDSENTEKLLSMMDCQIALLKVTDDELKVEV